MSGCRAQPWTREGLPPAVRSNNLFGLTAVENEMDKEIIELLKSLAGGAETLVIWYMVLDLAKHIITWCGVAACAWAVARSTTTWWAWLTGQDIK